MSLIRSVTQERLVFRLRGSRSAPPARPSSLRSVFRLCAESRRRKVTFADGTVDNEGLGRKKSKSCCVFHRRETCESHRNPE